MTLTGWLIRLTAPYRKIRFCTEGTVCRPRYWLFGFEVRRRTYWGYLYLIGYHRDRQC